MRDADHGNGEPRLRGSQVMAFGGVPNDPQRETMNEQAGFPDPSYPPTVRVTRLRLGECSNGQQISDHKGHSQ
jgi:hypothetical protein